MVGYCTKYKVDSTSKHPYEEYSKGVLEKDKTLGKDVCVLQFGRPNKRCTELSPANFLDKAVMYATQKLHWRSAQPPDFPDVVAFMMIRDGKYILSRVWASPYQQLDMLELLALWESRLGLSNFTGASFGRVLFGGSYVLDPLDEVAALVDRNYAEVRMTTQQRPGMRERHLGLCDDDAPAPAASAQQVGPPGVQADAVDQHGSRKRQRAEIPAELWAEPGHNDDKEYENDESTIIVEEVMRPSLVDCAKQLNKLMHLCVNSIRWISTVGATDTANANYAISGDLRGRIHNSPVMAWVYVCRICSRQVVVKMLSSEPDRRICADCKAVWEHRAKLAHKRLRFTPDGCNMGPFI
eukprot:364272-Chlamydomonas_euryale.AAC.5